ncbi:unnamed protein product, partial [Linum tenue]
RISSYIRRSRSGITYQPNLFCLFFGIGSCLYILILYFIKLSLCSCCTTPYLCGSYKCFNSICCDVHEWFRIFQRLEPLDCWGRDYFLNLYKYFYFANYYYFGYVLNKPDSRARFDKQWSTNWNSFVNRFFSSI